MTEEVVEETLKIETPSVKDAEMLVAIDDGLSFLLSGTLLLLHFNQETADVRGCHDAILIGIMIEKGPYLRRGLRHGEPEAAAEAEAKVVSLLRHALINVLFFFTLCVCLPTQLLEEITNGVNANGACSLLIRRWVRVRVSCV